MVSYNPKPENTSSNPIITPCPFCKGSGVEQDIDMRGVVETTKFKTGWIPVSERLPKAYEDVLIYDSYTAEVHVGWHFGPGFSSDITVDDEVMPHISHWSPLPPAPEVK